MFRIRPFYDVLTSPAGFHQDLLAYWIVFGVQFTSIYYRKYRERARQALQLEVDEAALRTQLVDAELSGLSRQLSNMRTSSAIDGRRRSRCVPGSSRPSCAARSCTH